MILETVIIVDASPLIGLARIGRLELLRQMATEICVSHAVYEEVISGRVDAPGAEQVRNASWLVSAEANPTLVRELRVSLGRGESEAIALAQERPGSLLVVDDARARRVVSRLKLRHTGTVGLLKIARKANLIPALRPALEAPVANGIFISPELIRAVLTEVGETT